VKQHDGQAVSVAGLHVIDAVTLADIEPALVEYIRGGARDSGGFGCHRDDPTVSAGGYGETA
jgi:hypothetical protein